MRQECAESSYNVKRLRLANNLSQADMAEIAGCSLRNYQNIELGKTQPGYCILKNIIRNLPADPRELFSDENQNAHDSAVERVKLMLNRCSNEQLSLAQKLLQSIIDLWPK